MNNQDLPKKLAIYIPRFFNGGIERSFLNLAAVLSEKGIKVSFVVNQVGFENLASQRSQSVDLVNLEVSNFWERPLRLKRYIEREKPDTLLAAFHYTGEVAIVTKLLTQVPIRVVVSVHTSISIESNRYQIFSSRYWVPTVMRILYPFADQIIAVSKGVAKDVSNVTRLPLEKITTIYNPVLTTDFFRKLAEPIDHCWFKTEETPVFLSVGRLEPQKNYANLITAFAKLREQYVARLMILGVGSEKKKLEKLVQQFSIEDDVLMPGYMANPYPYMAKAKAFVLSSDFEGLSNVLIEALAAGTNVISTNCPSGPEEVLNYGKHGLLVPVGDSDKLAEGMLRTLRGENFKLNNPEWLEQFKATQIANQYLDVLGLS